MPDNDQKECFESCYYRTKEEGFDYCFDGYSSWDEIEDDKFHVLRKAYLESKQKLNEYIEEKSK